MSHAKKYFENGGDVNATTEKGSTPLILALINGYSDNGETKVFWLKKNNNRLDFNFFFFQKRFIKFFKNLRSIILS